MTGSLLFPPLQITVIIVLIVNKPLTQMINHITAVKERDARLVADSTAQTLFLSLNPQIIVRTATPCSLGFIVRIIILQAINAKHIKLAETASNQLTVGAKVLSFTSGPLKFIDSLSFLPMPLASFPTTFNLLELKKGFFPHLFNTPENQQYVGRIPDLEFYDPDSMMSSKKEELINWHVEQVRRNVQFNFKEELISYCQSDVQLLKLGCQAFQQEFKREAGFNPMAHCFTIASACNLYWSFRRHRQSVALPVG